MFSTYLTLYRVLTSAGLLAGSSVQFDIQTDYFVLAKAIARASS